MDQSTQQGSKTNGQTRRTPVYGCPSDLPTPLSRRDPAEAALEMRGDYEQEVLYVDDERRAK